MTDKERIEAIMSHYHLNNVAFCNKVGLNQATLSNILRGSTNPSLPVLRSVLDAFPEISPVWMFVGQGEMIASAPTSEDQSSDSPSSPEDDLFSAFGQVDGGNIFNGAPQPSPVTPPTSALNRPTSTVGRQPSAPVSQPISVTDIVTGVVSQLQKPQRKVTEVRIFFDDGTYETFSAK